MKNLLLRPWVYTFEIRVYINGHFYSNDIYIMTRKPYDLVSPIIEKKAISYLNNNSAENFPYELSCKKMLPVDCY